MDKSIDRNMNTKRMQYINKISHYLLFGFVLFFIGSISSAQSYKINEVNSDQENINFYGRSVVSDSTITVEIPDTTAAPGAYLSIPILVQDSTDGYEIISYDFTLTYDSTMIEILDTRTSGTLSEDYFVSANTENTGSLTVSGFDTSPMSGRGPLMYIDLHILPSALGQTLIQFDHFNFNGSFPPVLLNDGLLSIQNRAPAPFQILEPDDSIELAINPDNLSNALQLAWQGSQDVDGDSIRYGLMIKLSSTKILPFENTTEHVTSIDYGSLIDLINENDAEQSVGEWSIYATDGIDTTYASNGPRDLVVNFTTRTDPHAGQLPSQYSLEQNYPNPFNPQTTIEYHLPSATTVTMEVSDASGRRIKTIVNNRLSPGLHQTTWDGTNDQGKVMSAGIYFYRLQTTDFSITKKMMLIK